ncbi:gliding motility-associated ABC transporter substrate-binding protein GldG [Wenyingzhuangia marina]|uniref:Protein involved in gliding motility GldG n=1 Tax=Wenyingzhuangia marina TaxID=1195760 RepID=A0A1M5SBA8_9FLAO|nr:gliding motility-associated ABC transporter substrate-binding protein GldG [Wenyingzhuangia marina]GGF61551.1 gliding motility-associated ABC transporter substrate-binding protein GldG [Wenyingzhuangia marina]SHH35786.1 protein involved in gliding motility GldG [Wenyingzhuangia marina]
MTKKKKHILFIVVLLVLTNIIANYNHYRWDVTNDQRYSISNPTQTLLKDLKKEVIFSVFLTGDLPFDFERLSKETAYFLDEIKSKNSLITFSFIPTQGKEESLIKQGLTPSRLTVQEDGKVSESVIFPYAIVSSGKKKALVNLLKSSYFENQDSQIENSIQNLEFAFADAIQKVTAIKKQKIAVLKGNGELEDIYQYDWLKTLGENYYMAPFTLDSIAKNPEKTLQELQQFDLAIISKPTEAFTEEEKFALDQFTVHGGKSIWLLDLVHTPKDSLMQNGKVLAYQRDLNLTDYLFNYGVRIKKHLVRDLYAASIPLATGKVGNNTQFDEFLWDYYPLIKSNNKHVISKNIGEVKLEFANSIDTLNPNIKKTPLLESSNLTKTLTVPSYVDLASITENADIKTYKEGSKILGILLEGDFKSAYRNRVKPFKNNFINQGTKNKMIVIADGDISTNHISKGQPLELGLDKWNNQFYSNKEFLMNAVNYLMNDKGLIQLRSKKVVINTINKPKAYQEKLKWQLINLIIPIAILTFFGFINFYIRKRKY